MLIKVIGSIKEYLRPKGRRPKLVGQGEMCIERICGATFLVTIFESKIGRKGRSKSVLHCTNNPVLESGNLSVFTDHTLAHPLNCRGGVVARLSA